jgi:hypothetical protein
MNAEEILLLRDIRRMFDKRPLDTSRVEISLMRGNVQLNGIIRTPRNLPNTILREEVDELEVRLRKDPRVKSLSNACKLVQPEKVEKAHFLVSETHHDVPKVEQD